MERLATAQLLDWKNRKMRKPLLLDGARQVGKTWLVERLFGKKSFPVVHTVDFLAEPNIAGIFDDGLEPERIVSNLEISRGEKSASTPISYFSMKSANVSKPSTR